MGAVRKETAIMERKQPDFNFNLGETGWENIIIKDTVKLNNVNPLFERIK